MNKLGENIRRRISQLGTTQRCVAKEAGVSHVLISRLISGNIKTTGKLSLIAKVLGLTVEQLESGDFKQSVTPNSDHGSNQNRIRSYDLAQIKCWDESTPLSNNEVELPLFKEVELAAGTGRTQVQESTSEKLRFSKSTLKAQGVDPSSAACCIISGDSMEPILPDKSTVAVDTDNKTIVDGKMYAIDYGGLLRVKFLYRLPSGGIRLRSANRDEYPDEDLTEKDRDSLTIIGRIFWYAVTL
jgi:phage repressor protein C with HTH and peptisase S24 domain